MIGVLFFFAALGAFNGILLSTYLFFFTKVKTITKYLLGGLVLALSIRIGKSVFLYFDPTLPKSYLQVGLTACFFIGPFLWSYIMAARDHLSVMPKSWTGLLVIYSGLACIVGWLYPYTIYPDYWNDIFIQVIYAQWVLFVFMSGYTLRNVFKQVLNSNVSLAPEDKWLLAIYSANVLICAVFVAALFGAPAIYYISGPLIFSLVLYLMVFGYFYRDSGEFISQRPIKRYANKEIDQPEAHRLLSRLDRLMETDGLYRNPDLKLRSLAESMELSPHRLSQLLNDNLGKSYSMYINERRVKAACALIATSDHLSLEGIGYEVGYQVKSTFFAAFKKQMGMTPASYKELVSAENPTQMGGQL